MYSPFVDASPLLEVPPHCGDLVESMCLASCILCTHFFNVPSDASRIVRRKRTRRQETGGLSNALPEPPVPVFHARRRFRATRKDLRERRDALVRSTRLASAEWCSTC